MIKTCFSTAFLCLMLSACGMKMFTSPDHNPVIEDRFQKQQGDEIVASLALDPQKRLFITNLNSGRFCSEFPTDVGLDTNSSDKLLLSLKKEGVADVDLQKVKTRLAQYQTFNHRSQSLQLFLAASYYYCQLYMNGNLDESALVATQLYLFEKTAELLSYEIQVTQGNTANPVTQSHITPPVSLKPTSSADSVLDKLDPSDTDSNSESTPENMKINSQQRFDRTVELGSKKDDGNE